MKKNRRGEQAFGEGEAATAPIPSSAELAAVGLQILVEDGPLLAVNKPAGLLSQGAPRGVFCLPDYVKAYLKQKYEKSGNVYLGVIHRLDRPVTGVVVFSRNSKAAARLAEMFRERTVTKTYLAILEQAPPQAQGTLVDFMRKIPEQARSVIEPGETAEAKRAELSYQTLGRFGPFTVVAVQPRTGRMHQIRLQFASRGCPIVGDQLYGARQTLALTPLRSDYTERIALHAWKLQLKHPIRYDDLELTAPLPTDWPAAAREIVAAAADSGSFDT